MWTKPRKRVYPACQQMTYLLIHGNTNIDMNKFDIKRYTTAMKTNEDWVKEKVQEKMVRTYWVPYPHQQPLAGRNLKKSPLHDKMIERKAFMGEDTGFEVPLFFLPDETK